MGVCWRLQRQKQMPTALWVPGSSNVCSSSVCEEIRAWHKAFASVVTLDCLQFGLNLCAWFRMHIVRYVSSTGVYWHFRIKMHKNEATGLCINNISCLSLPVTVTVGGQQHLLGLYDTAGQVNYCKTFISFLCHSLFVTTIYWCLLFMLFVGFFLQILTISCES